jgi:hypothetical protein
MRDYPRQNLCYSGIRLWGTSFKVDFVTLELHFGAQVSRLMCLQTLVPLLTVLVPCYKAGCFGALLQSWCHLTELVYETLSTSKAMLITFGYKSPS